MEHTESIADGNNTPIIVGDDKPSGTPDANSEPETIAGYPAISPITFDGGTDTGKPTDNGTNSGTDSGTGKRGRGRPRGTRNTINTQTEKTTADLTDLNGLLFSIHLMGAELLKTPELELDKEESTKIAAAIENVAKHYKMQFDPKKVAWWNLIAASGAIYGPRVIAIYKRTDSKKSNEVLGPVKVTPKKTPTPAPNTGIVDLKGRTPSEFWPQGGGADGSGTIG